MAAVIAINAASVAYKKARKATRKKIKARGDQPSWLLEFASRLPEKDDDELPPKKLSKYDIKSKQLECSHDRYEK